MDNKQLLIYIRILLLNVSAFNENVFAKVLFEWQSVKNI